MSWRRLHNWVPRCDVCGFEGPSRLAEKEPTDPPEGWSKRLIGTGGFKWLNLACPDHPDAEPTA